MSKSLKKEIERRRTFGIISHPDAGKTTLTNYFSHTLFLNKILEDYKKVPYLNDFYQGADVHFETEMSL